MNNTDIIDPNQIKTLLKDCEVVVRRLLETTSAIIDNPYEA